MTSSAPLPHGLSGIDSGLNEQVVAALRHYDQVAEAIRYLSRCKDRQPSLEEVAAAIGVSPAHLQRLFSAWVGISPKRFLQSLTRRHAVALLKGNSSVLDASLAAGLSGPGRLHDLTVTGDAMTPGEIASAGTGLAISRGWAPSPFGWMLLAWTGRGVCHLAFHDVPAAQWEEALVADWAGADHRSDTAGARALAAKIFPGTPRPGRLHLLLRGTNFQLKVWEALMRVPEGTLLSYGQLASAIGAPKASRAVGSAVAANRIGLLIPCHRVVRENGDFGNYRWGETRKLALNGWEQARQRGQPAAAVSP